MSSAFAVQLIDKRVRVVLNQRGPKRVLYAYFSYKGKRHNLSTGHTVEREAREQARKLVQQVAARHGLAVSQPITEVVEAYLEVRWPNGAPGNSTYLGTKSRIKRFAAWCEENGSSEWYALPLREASAVVQRYIDARRKVVGAEALKNERVVISTFASYLIKRNMATWPANPAEAKRIDSPRVVRVIAKPLTKEAIQSFLTAIKDHPLTAVCVLILSGVRPKAALADVCWRHVDLKEGRVITTEKNVSRQIPLTPWAVTELSRFEGKEKERVWTNAKRKGFAACETLAVANKTPEISLQALRRAFIFRLWQMGVSPQLASRLAGNTVETAMKHYADSSLLDTGGVLEKLDWMNTAGKEKQDSTKTTPKQSS